MFGRAHSSPLSNKAALYTSGGTMRQSTFLTIRVLVFLPSDAAVVVARCCAVRARTPNPAMELATVRLCLALRRDLGDRLSASVSAAFSPHLSASTPTFKMIKLLLSTKQVMAASSWGPCSFSGLARAGESCPAVVFPRPRALALSSAVLQVAY